MRGDTAARLDRQLRAAGIPIVGVSVGDDANKATWTVLFQDVATPDQRTAAAAILAAYTEPAAGTLQDEEAQGRLMDKALASVLVALYEAIPTPTRTLAQTRARAIALFKLP